MLYKLCKKYVYVHHFEVDLIYETKQLLGCITHFGGGKQYFKIGAIRPVLGELSKTGVKITWGRDVHHNSQNLKIILIQCKITKLLLKIAGPVIVNFVTKYCMQLKMMFAKPLHCSRIVY